MELQLLDSNDLDQEIQNQIVGLYRQLNANIKQTELKDVLSEKNNVIMVICREGETICGMALLATYKVISGYRGMIEDVIVDANFRSKGIGRKLMLKLLAEAKYRKLNEIMLFTGHHRVAAISLYKSLGFTLRDSGLYNLRLN